MRVPKLERYRQLAAFPNFFEPPIRTLLGKPFERAGAWNETFFRRPAPLILEMGCGWGDFSLGLARRFPARNVLGLDVKGGRIWRGAATALSEGLKNVGFIRIEGEALERLFAPGELDEIWVTFPTPYLRKPEKMLISPTFLARYRSLLSREGLLHLKTDVRPLAEYARRIWPLCGFRVLDAELPEEARSEADTAHETIDTNFQARAVGKNKSIYYIKAIPISGEIFPVPESLLRLPWSR